MSQAPEAETSWVDPGGHGRSGSVRNMRLIAAITLTIGAIIWASEALR
jgi:hypothetical protein